RGVPGQVVAHGTLLDRAHAVLPAVAGDEVAAGVAHGAHAQLAGELEDVLAEALLIGLGVLGLVDAGVHAPAQVLDEGAEGAPTHRRDTEGGIESESDLR